ncbi:Cyclic AMP-responsive element-binding protein 3-like protein 1, partial [Armadillidium nasatum]
IFYKQILTYSFLQKGATGALYLTEEEKRTLISEGYAIPSKLPLTKAEEKSLKKIRRKIKNKISAQESRRKKKEYLDTLEHRVDLLTQENNAYRKKFESLQQKNQQLLQELERLQNMVNKEEKTVKRYTLKA